MEKSYLITGGAGFIGSNLARKYLTQGKEITIFDNLSRSGSQRNLAWLRSMFGEKSFHLIQADVRDEKAVNQAVIGKDVIVHLAGQVAVTTSVVNPREDMEINVLGTFNVLEAARKFGKDPIVLYASTNKVYGGMDDVPVTLRNNRWEYENLPFGASEHQPLDFHSPYGCSKGTGDQYARDYFRIYGLRTVVFRQSCIYGPRQFGVEDQGWVAWMVIAASTNRPITIFGDGKQIRDLLHVDDLIRGYELAISKIELAQGQVFNVGGGPANTLSVWSELGPMLSRLLNKPINVAYSDWRPGDQRVFVADIRKASQILGWEPLIGVSEGVESLIKWVQENKIEFQE
ncbi:MAG TPA: SDR family NAD(P)-dependent oxidoreductase [Anaerolineales bacterium]|nr:SDR family NAD(P)-dependent oxidoreductase [Anaerolineales bacterium]